MNDRIAIKKVPLTPGEALERWKTNVTAAMDGLREALEQPFETERDERVRIKPGEPGYDEAPYEEAIAYHPWTIKAKVEKLSSS